MKNLSPALLALFATNQPFEQFDLYTITLSSGFVLRYTNCSFDVVTGGHTWLCSRSVGGIVIDEEGDSGPRASWTSDLNTGTWQVTVMPRDGIDKVGAMSWLPAVRAGIMDEATFQVDRGYIVAWPSTLKLVPLGTINVFYGRIAEIDFGRSSVQINANDPRELLAIELPRNLYSAECRYALYDAQCTVNKATLANNGTVTAAPTSQQITAALPAHPDSYFALGEVVFNTGDNAGLRMMVRQSTAAGSLTLLAPLPFVIHVGDTFTAYPGCNKTQAACNGFANILNFGGFTYIPAAETAV